MYSQRVFFVSCLVSCSLIFLNIWACSWKNVLPILSMRFSWDCIHKYLSNRCLCTSISQYWCLRPTNLALAYQLIVFSTFNARPTRPKLHFATSNAAMIKWGIRQCYHDVHAVIFRASSPDLPAGHCLSGEVSLPVHSRPTPQIQTMARWLPTIS